MEQVIGGLNSLSLEVAVLDTQSLIELYYNTYNPEIAKIAPLADTSSLQIETQV